MKQQAALENARLDRWLHAARIFKTRALAATAIRGGKVHVNGVRAKPSRPIEPGDRLEVTRGPEQLELIVEGLLVRRVSAKLAAELYRETPESLARREALREQMALARDARVAPPRRPDKRERRQIHKFVRGEGRDDKS